MNSSQAGASLWLDHSLRRARVTAIDWCASEVLTYVRELRLRCQQRKLSATSRLLKTLARAFAEESAAAMARGLAGIPRRAARLFDRQI